MTEWQQFRDKLLAEKAETRQEYARLEPTFQVIAEIVHLRRERGLSQKELAARMGRQQPAIARLEAGRANPTLSFLREVAEALDARLVVRLEPGEVKGESTKSNPERAMRKAPA